MRRLRRLGAIALSEQPMPAAANEEAARMLAEGDRAARHRPAAVDQSAAAMARPRHVPAREPKATHGPILSDAALAADRRLAWLAMVTRGKDGSARHHRGRTGRPPCSALLPWPLQRRLEAEAPTHFEAPTGSRVPIDYEAEGGPKIAIRVQELFGLDRHPAIAGGRIPLLIELLSPAHRPVQMTRDLPGFWRGSYAAVRAEMRGRYPKHPWPDDPLAAPATRRAKPRKD